MCRVGEGGELVRGQIGGGASWKTAESSGIRISHANMVNVIVRR